jgi:hypothetical protein
MHEMGICAAFSIGAALILTRRSDRYTIEDCGLAIYVPERRLQDFIERTL